MGLIEINYAKFAYIDEQGRDFVIEYKRETQ